MSSVQDFVGPLLALLFPWYFMLISLSYLPGTIQRLYKQSGFQALFPWHRLQDAWFSSFWAWAGPRIRDGNRPRITALLEGRVIGAKAGSDVIIEPVSGVVLDIGPGLGYWVDLYRQADVPLRQDGVKNRSAQKGIKKIYGVEPNSDSHSGLLQRVQEAGLDGTYEIMPVGIEALCKATPGRPIIEKGSVDCIVTLLCLCSIPEPEENIRELYGYLKKGGRWYVFEHVVAKGSRFMKLYQGKQFSDKDPAIAYPSFDSLRQYLLAARTRGLPTLQRYSKVSRASRTVVKDRSCATSRRSVARYRSTCFWHPHKISPFVWMCVNMLPQLWQLQYLWW